MYRLTLNGLTKEEAMHLLEEHSGGEVRWTNVFNQAVDPKVWNGDMFSWPKDQMCSIEKMANNSATCAKRNI